MLQMKLAAASSQLAEWPPPAALSMAGDDVFLTAGREGPALPARPEGTVRPRNQLGETRGLPASKQLCFPDAPR